MSEDTQTGMLVVVAFLGFCAMAFGTIRSCDIRDKAMDEKKIEAQKACVEKTGDPIRCRCAAEFSLSACTAPIYIQQVTP